MSRSRSKRRSKSRKPKKVSKTQTGLVIPDGAKRCRGFDERGNELWVIENIIDEREVDGRPQYLVKWEGWPYRYCTWETEESFLENMDIIKDYVKQKNEGIRRVFKVEEIDGGVRKKKPETTTAKNRNNRFKSSSRRKGSECQQRNSHARHRSRSETSRSRNSSKSPQRDNETKVVIQKITLSGESGLIEVPGNQSSSNGQIPQNSISYLNPTTKPMDIFLCRDAQAIKLEEAQKKQPEKMSVEAPDSDDDYFQDIQDENLSQNSFEKSICNDFAVPLVENEFENSTNFRVVVEDCFLKVPGQIESLRFKVAFYDNQDALKCYDYFNYDEIKQKNWSGALLDFYARELLSEVKQNGSNLTPNIRVV